MKLNWRRRFIRWIKKVIRHPEGKVLPKWLMLITVVFKWLGQIYAPSEEFKEINNSTKRKIAAAKAMRTMQH